MTLHSMPSEDNDYLADHIAILRSSLRHWTGRELVPPRLSDSEAARYVFDAPIAVVSHDTAKDPLFNYANRTALELFAMTWNEFIALPSRLSVESDGEEKRAELLSRVTAQGFVDNYQGVRIGRHGHRFVIEGAVIWNLLGPTGMPYGQAAMFEHWKFL